MEPKIAEIADRIRSLREILNFSLHEMAEAAGVSVEKYESLEKGECQDFSFTFLYRCAEKFGVDIIELLTGEAPHLTGYTVVRGGKGLPIKRRENFEYYHLAYSFKDKLSETFLVKAPYHEDEQDKPIPLNSHVGQEFDYVLEGSMIFAHGIHREQLFAGDSVYYNSGVGHGMIAAGGKPCTFLAVVMKDTVEEK